MRRLSLKEGKLSVVGSLIAGLCYVGRFPCTYDDSTGRIRASAGELVQDLELKRPANSGSSRMQRPRLRNFWLGGPVGRTLRLDIQSEEGLKTPRPRRRASGTWQ